MDTNAQSPDPSFDIVFDRSSGISLEEQQEILAGINAMTGGSRLVPDGAEVLLVDTREKFSFVIHYKPKPRLKVLKESFKAHDYNVRGLKAGGIRLASKEAGRLDPKSQG